MDRKTIECWAREVATERVVTDRCLVAGPAFIFHLALASDSGGIATAEIYDGVSAKGDLKIDMTCIDDYYAQHDYWPPMYFGRGIYVALGSNVKSVIVRYRANKS